jgi:hypothetical protein
MAMQLLLRLRKRLLLIPQRIPPLRLLLRVLRPESLDLQAQSSCNSGGLHISLSIRVTVIWLASFVGPAFQAGSSSTGFSLCGFDFCTSDKRGRNQKHTG